MSEQEEDTKNKYVLCNRRLLIPQGLADRNLKNPFWSGVWANNKDSSVLEGEREQPTRIQQNDGHRIRDWIGMEGTKSCISESGLDYLRRIF